MAQNLSKQEELRNRTKRFALRVIRLFRHSPRTAEAQVLGKELLRSETSIGANYRAAGRARSKAEFISKMGIVVEEADEYKTGVRARKVSAAPEAAVDERARSKS